MNKHQEVEQAMQHMHLIEHHERPQALIGKTISFFVNDAKMVCGSVLRFEIELKPREESPPGHPPYPREVLVTIWTTLPELITVSRIRFHMEKTVDRWEYGSTVINFEDDTIR